MPTGAAAASSVAPRSSPPHHTVGPERERPRARAICTRIERPNLGSPESPRPRRRRQALLRVAITAIVVGAGIGAVSTLHAMDWRRVGAALAGCAPIPLALAFLVSTAQVYAQLARFVVLVPREARDPLFDLLDATAVGQLLNYAAPLRGGDAYKLIRLAPRADTLPAANSGVPGKARFSILLAALLVERVADISALIVMAAWASFPEVRAWLGTALPSAAVAAKIGISLAVAAIVAALFAARIQRLLGSFLAHVGGALWSRAFARSFAISLLTWSLDAGTLFWTTRSVGAYALSFREVMHSVFVLNLGIAMPVTVGNLGVFEASLAYALTTHGIARDDAMAIAMLEHIAKFAGLFLCILSLRAGGALRRRARALG